MTIEELKRLESEATAGQWRTHRNSSPMTVMRGAVEVRAGEKNEFHPYVGPHNAALIAALRNSAPALLACAELVAEMADGECWDPQVIHDGHGTSIETEHEEDCGECLPCRARTLMAAFKASP